MKPCSLYSKHKWVWTRDVTLTSAGARPGTLKISRRGVYRCECGELKYGAPRSGL